MEIAPFLLLSGDPFGFVSAGFREVLSWLLPILTFLIGAAIPFARRSRSTAPDETGEPEHSVLPTYKRMYTEFCRELDRVRRYDRSLSILVVKLEEEQLLGIREGLLEQVHAAGPKGNPDTVVALAVQVMFANVGYLLEDVLRDMDLATTDLGRSRYVVLLPELSRKDAEGTTKRLENLILEMAGVQIRTGVAEFRTDGVLIEDLVQVASEQCDRADAGSGSTITLNPAPAGTQTFPVRG